MRQNPSTGGTIDTWQIRRYIPFVPWQPFLSRIDDRGKKGKTLHILVIFASKCPCGPHIHRLKLHPLDIRQEDIAAYDRQTTDYCQRFTNSKIQNTLHLIKTMPHVSINKNSPVTG